MAKGYHHVTRDQRCQIYAFKAINLSLRNIAKQVGTDVSTISRELARNTGGCGYRFKQADSLACERRAHPSQTPKKLTEDFKEKIESKLLVDWSPEHISGRFKLKGVSISHESIYRYVWKNKRAGGQLYKHLRHHGKRYNKRSSGKAGRGCIPNRVDISERPAIVESKSRIGDWEGDTVISAISKTAILTLVDRHSKLTRIKKLGRKTAENVDVATRECLLSLPHPVLTITYDNGMEFAAHRATALALNALSYFATPYHSWERGLNEHTNGLIRQYLAKTADFKEVTDAEIQKIENKLNHRPRKVLNFKTPYEVFFAETQFTSSVALQC